MVNNLQKQNHLLWNPLSGINLARNWRHVDESTGGICRAAAAWIWPTSGRSCWAFHRGKTIQNARKHSENIVNTISHDWFFSGPHFQTHLHFSFLIIFEVHLSPIPHVVGSMWWQKRGGSFKVPKAWWKRRGESGSRRNCSVLSTFQVLESFFPDYQPVRWCTENSLKPVSTRTSLAAAEWNKNHGFFDHGHHGLRVVRKSGSTILRIRAPGEKPHLMMHAEAGTDREWDNWWHWWPI